MTASAAPPVLSAAPSMPVASSAAIFTERLGRPLSDAERVVLGERLDGLGEDRLVDVVLTRDREALAAWLGDPSAR